MENIKRVKNTLIWAVISAAAAYTAILISLMWFGLRKACLLILDEC